MLGASLFFRGEKPPKGNILFLKGNILSQIFFSKNIHKKIIISYLKKKYSHNNYYY
jgi:hypothetical protein